MIKITPVPPEQLSPRDVTARKQLHAAILSRLAPGYDFDNGFLSDVVLHLNSVLEESRSQGLQRLHGTVNPVHAGLQANQVDSEMVDAVAASYGLSRLQAVRASGQIRVVVDRNSTIVVPRSFRLSSDSNIIVETSSSFVARPVGNELRGATDRRLTDIGGGLYSFVVDAQMITPGSAFQLSSGTQLQQVNDLIPGFVSASVAVSFFGGQDEESDASLLRRITTYFPAKTLSTRFSLAASLRSSAELPSVYAVSTIGYGDIELKRTALGQNTVDTYVRTALLPADIGADLTATAKSVANNGRMNWSVTVPRDYMPGFYRISSMELESGNTPSNTEIVRDYDLTDIPTELVPYLGSSADAAFSRYQTAEITFQTPKGSYSVGDEQGVTVGILGLPGIAKAQEILSRREFRFVGGDILVKAPIPVFVSISISVVADPGVLSVDTNAIRSAVAARFNQQGFAETIYASEVSTIVNQLLPSSAVVQSVTGIGQIVGPDGNVRLCNFTDRFEVDSVEDLGISPRTAAFYVATGDISINTYSNAKPAIY